MITDPVTGHYQCTWTGFNPSRDDHGPGRKGAATASTTVSIPPGMITDLPRRRKDLQAQRVSIPPGMITDLINGGSMTSWTTTFQSLQG